MHGLLLRFATFALGPREKEAILKVRYRYLRNANAQNVR